MVVIDKVAHRFALGNIRVTIKRVGCKASAKGNLKGV